MAGLLSAVYTISLRINQLLLFLSALCIFIMIIVDGLNVIGAKVGVMIVPSGKTIIEEMLVAMIYIGMGYVVLNQGHIKTDIFKSRFPKKVSFALDALTNALIIGISLYIFTMSADTFWLFLDKGLTLPGVVQIPKWPVQLILSLSFLNMAICTFLLFIRSCSRK